MPKLDCNVTSCLHYADNCCCKAAIIVDGCHAEDCCDTCCGSYDEKSGDSFTNVYKTPEKKLEVDCEAVNCVFNDKYHCSAEHIGIAGDGASESAQTECASFKKR